MLQVSAATVAEHMCRLRSRYASGTTVVIEHLFLPARIALFAGLENVDIMERLEVGEDEIELAVRALEELEGAGCVKIRRVFFRREGEATASKGGPYPSYERWVIRFI